LKLLSHLRPRLLCEDVFELDVKLLLLLDEDILLSYLFRLSDEPLLQTLDLLDHLIGLMVRALEFPPSVDVHRLLQLVVEELLLLLLL
jgi:hypothetical protein